MEAIILAGGLGTRLRSVVDDRPKVLSVVAGRPFLAYIIDDLAAKGVGHFIFATGYLSEQVETFLSKKYPHLNYSISVEDKPLGTGGAIQKALLQVTDGAVFIVNADTFFDVDLQAMYGDHIASKADCTIAVKEMFNFDRYGVIALSDERRVTAFKEKDFRKSGLINGGLYLLNTRQLLTRNFPEVFSFENDFLEKFTTELKIVGFIASGYFIDIGIPADYAAAQLTFANFNRKT